MKSTIAFLIGCAITAAVLIGALAFLISISGDG